MIFSLIFIGLLFTHKVNSISSKWIALNNIGKELSECKGRDLGCSGTQGGLKSPQKPNELLKSLTQRITNTIRSAKAREGSLEFLFFIQAWPCLQCLLSVSLSTASLCHVSKMGTFEFLTLNTYKWCPDITIRKKLNLLEYF